MALLLKPFPRPSISSLAFWAFLIFLLSTVIFLPLSSDQAIYLRGAEMLLEGGKLYKDYVDVKPPLLFYMYAAAVTLFGKSELSVRLADFLWQLATLVLLYRITASLFQSTSLAKATAVVYAVSYMILGLGSTMHCEALAAPAIALLLYTHLRGKSFAWALATGILCGFIAGLKTTLLISIPALLLYDMLVRRKPWSALLMRNLGIAVGALLALALIYAPLLTDAEMRQGYADVLVFTSYYASQPPLDMSFIRHTVKSLGSFFGDMYTLSLTVAAVIGFGYCLGGSIHTLEQTSNEKESQEEEGRKAMFLALTLTIFFLLSVVAERKFLPNHFTRMYIPLSMAAGVGGLLSLRRALQKFRLSLSPISRATLIVSLPLFLLFSPLPRMGNLFLPMAYRLLGKSDAYYAYYNREAPAGWEYGNSNPVIAWLQQHRQPGERFLISGTTVARLYLAAGEPVWSAFGQSTYYYGRGSSPRWLERFHQEVQQADWLLVYTTDRYTPINGHDKTTLECIEQDNAIADYFARNFRPELKLEEMTLYHRVRN